MDVRPLYLLPGESLVWEGRPVHSTMLRPNDVLLIPFSLVWALISLLPMAFLLGALGHLDQPSAVPFALAGVYFGSVTIRMLVSRFVVRAFTSRHTRYVVTDRRVVVLTGRSRARMRSAYLSSLRPPVFTERRDGSGSIAFGAFPSIPRGARGVSLRAFSSEPSVTPVLWYVADVRRVRDLIAAVQPRPTTTR